MRPVAASPTTLLITAALLTAGGTARPAAADDGLATAEQGIIHGEAIDGDTFPSAGQLIFQGTISLWGSTMELTQPLCTATLIAPDVLLSASHCVEEFFLTYGMGEIDDAVYCVSFEEDLSWMGDMDAYQGNPPLPDDAVCGSHWLQHPEWDVQQLMGGDAEGLGNWHDVSLVLLDSVVDDRPFAYLPDSDEGDQLYEEMEVDIVGYGQRTPEPQDPWNPDPEAAFKRHWAESFINELGDHEMQIGADDTTGRKCHGDSGGPTYVDVETELSVTRRVIGVTTRAYSAAEDCNVGGIDMRVDAFLDWIDEELRAACDDGTRVWCDEPGILRPPPVEDPDDDDDDAGGDDDDLEGDGGCECSTGTPHARFRAVATVTIGVLALLAVRRRRGDR